MYGSQVPLSESVRSSLLGDDGSGNATQESLNDATEEVSDPDTHNCLK